MEPYTITMYSVRLLIVSILLQAYTSRCCLEHERVALLELKSCFVSLSTTSEFSKYLASELSSWDLQGNCCLWNRVACNQSMQHVTVLSLSYLMDMQHSKSNGNNNLLNVSLFHPFRELISLDLSYNYINRLVGNGGYKMLNLPRLETLNFGFNNLHDKQELGDLVGSLNSLKELFLNDNRAMDGNFPGQELAHLKQLRVLDLSNNYLNGSLRSQDLCKLRSLEQLRLGQNYLSGSLPSQDLCKLRSLEELRLDRNQLSGILPTCLWSLTSLRALDLSDNSFSGNLPPTINLPSLEWLSISNNNFHGRVSLSYLMNHSRLQGLSLSNNALQLQMDDSSFGFYSTSKLVALGLSRCNLNGQSQIFLKFLSYQSNLEYLDLSSNGLFGLFPAWLLQNNSNLCYLNLGNNSFNGSLDLPKHNSYSNLSFLDISSNNLAGMLPKDFGTVLSSIVALNSSKDFWSTLPFDHVGVLALNLSFNSFDGHIPHSVGNMIQLRSLDLSNNNFFGEVPRGLLSDLTNLQLLSLSNNNLGGEIIPIYMNLPSLKALYLNGNNFVGTLQWSLIVSPLGLLDVSDNEATGEIPTWIGDFENLNSVSLARNDFHGDIPSQLCQREGLGFLDLSGNRFIGRIPSCFGLITELRFLHMHGNHLTGVIPEGLATLSSLETLDLSNNHLSGGIPQWIYKLSHLVIILLGGNQLEGELPVQLCRLRKANIIDLSNNSLSGVIPSCFQHMSFGERKLDDSRYGSWALEGLYMAQSYLSSLDFPKYELYENFAMQEEVNFIVKSRYSFYKGNILTIMSELDLSSNKLIGVIPPELGELGSLHALNLSHNHLSGSIPRRFSKLKSVESLDLSSNNLSGAIPSELVVLTSLEIFNVSYNNLSREVPETGQFGTFDEKNYQGNHLLCGSRLPKSCGMDEPMPNIGNTSTKEGDEGFDVEVFLWSFGMSSVTILTTFIVVLAINPYWRIAWFAFLDVKFLWWFNP